MSVLESTVREIMETEDDRLAGVLSLRDVVAAVADAAGE